MSTIVTNYLSPGAGNIGLILDHNIDDLPLFRSDANSQAVISINTNGLYEFLTFQALLFWGSGLELSEASISKGKFSVLKNKC